MINYYKDLELIVAIAMPVYKYFKKLFNKKPSYPHNIYKND